MVAKIKLIYNKTKNYKEHVMIFLALFAVGMLFAEFVMDLDPEISDLFVNIDLVICAIFAAEFYFRVKKVEKGERLRYCGKNIFDIIAFMPFNRVLRVARLARLTRLTRLSRMSRLTKLSRFTRLIRIVGFARRFWGGFKKFITTNGLHYMLIFTLVIILLGGITIFFIEINTIGDALWWSLVTTTTVGYGDISPVTTAGRIVAGILMLVGIGLVGMVTSSLATFFIKEETENANTNIEFIKGQLNNLDDLSPEEIEEIQEIINALLESKK